MTRDRYVEAMARAMFENLWAYSRWAELGDNLKRDWITQATAALDAYEALAREEAEAEKSVVMNMRVNAETLSLIDRAAAALGMTRSAFMREAAIEEARSAVWPPDRAMLAARPKE